MLTIHNVQIKVATDYKDSKPIETVSRRISPDVSTVADQATLLSPASVTDIAYSEEGEAMHITAVITF